MVTRGGHPLSFLEGKSHFQRDRSERCRHIKEADPGRRSDLCLLLWQLHIVENAEHDPEEILPPVPLKGVSIALHDLEHDCEASVRSRHTVSKTLDRILNKP